MKLSRFRATALHGFLNFDVKFHDRLTLLTGINGSGKTTILNAIVALISPNLQALQSVEFRSIQLDFVDDAGQKAFIKATHEGTTVELKVSHENSGFHFSEYPADLSTPPYRQAEMEAEHYKDLLATNVNHPVLQFIASLPTPMFLGLDRRARLTEDPRRFPNSRIRVAGSRNVFGGSSTTSVSEAVTLAQDAYRDARFRASRISDELLRQMLVSLLSFAEEDYGALSLPTKTQIQNLARVKADLSAFPAIFNLPKAQVEHAVGPFLEQLERTLSKIPSDANVERDIAKTSGRAPDYFEDLIRWNTNKSQLQKIGVISEMVSKYNTMMTQALHPFETYKELINGFLRDSGKNVEVGDHGEVYVKIDGINDRKEISSLSSGEAQIFVMITNLTFNPSAQKANVLIIDEPELSLHVRWQELFIDSLMTASVNIQFIMATHAPSIILDRIDNCVNIVSRKAAA